MLFYDLFDELKKLLPKFQNNPAIGNKEMRLREDKKYIGNMASRFDSMKKTYEKELGNKNSDEDYFAVALFFLAFLNGKNLDKEPPIEFFDKAGLKYIETSFTQVRGKSLKEIIKDVIISLIMDISIKILNPKNLNAANKKITDFIKPVNMSFKQSMSEEARLFDTVALFREL